MASLRPCEHSGHGAYPVTDIPRWTASRRQLIVSHLASCLLGMAIAGYFAVRTLPFSDTLGAHFEQAPLSQAMKFAYAWGNDRDASALLASYAEVLKIHPDPMLLSLSDEVSFTAFRRAIVESRTHAELLELCRATAKCTPDALDAVIGKLRAERKVADAQ